MKVFLSCHVGEGGFINLALCVNDPSPSIPDHHLVAIGYLLTTKQSPLVYHPFFAVMEHVISYYMIEFKKGSPGKGVI